MNIIDKLPYKIITPDAIGYNLVIVPNCNGYDLYYYNWDNNDILHPISKDSHGRFYCLITNLDFDKACKTMLVLLEKCKDNYIYLYSHPEANPNYPDNNEKV